MGHRSKRRLAGLVGVLAALAPWQLTSAQQPEITVGALLPLTGPAAPIGIEEQQGVQFTVDRVNAKGGVRGRKIKVLFEDSQGKPDQGVLGFNRLVDLNNIPVTLTAYSSISLAIAPLATRRKVLVINPAAQTNKLETASPYLINTIPLVNNEIAHIAAFAFKHVGKTAAIVYENAAAGIDSRDDFKKHFEAAGGKILADEAVEFGQTNYRSTLLKVASVRPELVFIAITQSHAAFAEQVGQTPGFPIAVGSTFSRPFFGFPSTKGWYHTAIVSGTTPSDEKEFNAKFGTKEMGFFAREYANSTDIILQRSIAFSARTSSSAATRSSRRSSTSRPSSLVSPRSPSHRIPPFVRSKSTSTAKAHASSSSSTRRCE